MNDDYWRRPPTPFYPIVPIFPGGPFIIPIRRLPSPGRMPFFPGPIRPPFGYGPGEMEREREREREQRNFDRHDEFFR